MFWDEAPCIFQIDKGVSNTPAAFIVRVDEINAFYS